MNPRPKQILIVDDASTVRLYHRSVLEKAGFVVHEALNGVEALEKALVDTFDLFVVDVNMPKLDGFSFLKELRSLDQAQAPAVIVSTESQDIDRDQAWRAGANAYLVKPVRPEVLVPLVRVLTGEEEP